MNESPFDSCPLDCVGEGSWGKHGPKLLNCSLQCDVGFLLCFSHHFPDRAILHYVTTLLVLFVLIGSGLCHFFSKCLLLLKLLSCPYWSF